MIRTISHLTKFLDRRGNIYLSLGRRNRTITVGRNLSVVGREGGKKDDGNSRSV